MPCDPSQTHAANNAYPAMCVITSHMRKHTINIQRIHISYIYFYTLWSKPQITIWGIQCRKLDSYSCFGLVQSPFSHLVYRAGWPLAVCLHSLAAQCCAQVLHIASLLRFVRIPFGALEFASSSNSRGKHLLASEKNLPFGKEFSASSERNPSR